MYVLLMVSTLPNILLGGAILHCVDLARLQAHIRYILSRQNYDTHSVQNHAVSLNKVRTINRIVLKPVSRFCSSSIHWVIAYSL